MKKSIYNLIFGIILISNYSLSQTTIDVVDATFKIGALGEEVFYYGFAEGDKIIFNFEELKGKELKEIEIIELPTSSKFMDYKTISIVNKSLTVQKTGIYKFRFSNSAATGRICKYKLQRIASSEAKVNFNTSVYWKTISDTTYTTVQEKYLVKKDTTFSDFYSSSPFVSSSNALNGNKNYQIIDFMLPTNTKSWSFYIGTGNEGKAEYERSQSAFLKSATNAAFSIPGWGPMASLALTGVSYMNKVQGADNVKYWFLSSAQDVTLFQSGQSFSQYKKGDVVNEASQMTSPNSGKVYIAILNDNSVDPITLTIKATAVIVTEVWDTRPVQKMHVNFRVEAYLNN